MALKINHPKINMIPDWNQADLDAQINAGNFDPGTTLAEITLAQDWNSDHTISGTLDQTQNNVAVDGVTIMGDGTPLSPLSAVTGGSGDVTGPASSVDGNVVLFNGVSGKIIKDSGQSLSDYLLSTTAASTYVPLTRTVNGQALSSNITLTTANINDSTNRRYVTDAQLVVIGNTSGMNTGNVTLAGENYLSLTGQQITANSVNLSNTNVTGTLAAARFPALTGDVTTTAGSLTTAIAAGVIVNADVNASAGIALTKLAATTASRGLVSDASGFITASATTATEISYVNGVTSSIQTQINGKQTSGNYITALTGDVTASGPGSATATLSNTTVTPGSYTSANITVDAKGRITAASSGGGGGGGDVSGPGSSTNNAIAVWDGVSGDLLSDSVVTLDPSTGDIQGVGILEANIIAANTILGVGYTGNKAIVSGSDLGGFAQLVESATTDTQIGYLSTVTSNVQTQLNGKQASGTYVTSVTGTTNRIASSGGTTPAIDIAATYVGQTSITTLGTISTGTWQGTVVGGTYGGTGVNNGARTLTMAGSVTHAGAFTQTFTATANTSVTLPTSGTLYGSATGSITSSQLATSLSDETGTGFAVFATSPNLVTPNLGTPSTVTLTNGIGLPIGSGTTGTLQANRGGTGLASYTAGDILYASTSVSLSALAAAAAGNSLLSGTTPSWGKIGLTTHVSGILPIANGGTGVSSSNPVIQRVSTIVSSVATGTTSIPYDDTIPQNTEGDEYMTITITPKSATNILVIETQCFTSSINVTGQCSALFQDSTVNALAAANSFQSTAQGLVQGNIRHTMVAGTTSATTFKLRCGLNTASTMTFNGNSGARRYGGVINSYMTVTEYST